MTCSIELIFTSLVEVFIQCLIVVLKVQVLLFI